MQARCYDFEVVPDWKSRNNPSSLLGFIPVIKSKDGLKSFLLTSRILSPTVWAKVESELTGIQDVPTILQILERRQMLTPLQTGRILKNETEGLVLGRYKLLYRNASGSFARVFRAESVDDGKTVALKLLRERWVDDPRTVAGFVREARICQKFAHPNIVPILDIGNEGRFYYFTMEFVEGGNLRDFMKIRKTLSPLEATRCLYEICQGLEYALKMGASHRDLKLTNVLMSSTGVAKLVDFGLAGAENPSQAGTSDDVQRALEYSTLERGTNAPRNDPRSDIFFAGSIYYELLCGEGPWTRTLDREEKLMLTRYSKFRPLRQVMPGLPAGVYKIVQTMMELNPSSRYQSCTEVNKDLRALLAELGEVVEDTVGGNTTSQGSSGSKSASSTPVNSGKKNFNLLVVEAGRKREKKLKQYFEQHAFMLNFIESASDAFEKLKSKSPPDGVLFLADADSAPVMEVYPKVQAYARTVKVPCVALFAAADSEAVKKQIYSTKFGATMFQPTSPRDLRQHFAEISGFDSGTATPPEAPKRKDAPAVKTRPETKTAKPENHELDDLDVDSDVEESPKGSGLPAGTSGKTQTTGNSSPTDSTSLKESKSANTAQHVPATDSITLSKEAGAVTSAPKPAAPVNATQKAAAIRAAQRAAEKAAVEQVAREAVDKANGLIADAERLAAEKVAAEEAVHRKAEEKRLALENAAAEKAIAERQTAEKVAQKKADEEEQIAQEKAEADRKSAEKAARKKAEEEERIAFEKAESERKAAEKAARKKAEEERLAREKAEAEKIAAEEAARKKAEEERIALEKAEAERIAAEEAARKKAEEERIALEKAEAKRIAAEEAARKKAEEERIALEKAEAERIAAEEAAQKKAEEERIALEKAEAERIAAEEAARKKAEEERIALEKAEAERIAAEEAARKKAEEERLAAERAAAAERAKVEIERAEKAIADKFAAARQAVEEQQFAATAAVEMAQLERQAAEKLTAERLVAERAIGDRESADREATEKTAAAERAQQEAEAFALEMAERIAAARRVVSGLDTEISVVAASFEEVQLLAALKAEEKAKVDAATRIQADEEQLLAEIEAEENAKASLQAAKGTEANSEQLSAHASATAWIKSEDNMDESEAAKDEALQAELEADEIARLDEEARAEKSRVKVAMAEQKKVEEARTKQSLSRTPQSKAEKKSGKKKGALADTTTETAGNIEAPRPQPSTALSELPLKQKKTSEQPALDVSKSSTVRSDRTRELGKRERSLRDESVNSEKTPGEKKSDDHSASTKSSSSKLIVFGGLVVAVVLAIVWLMMFR